MARKQSFTQKIVCQKYAQNNYYSIRILFVLFYTQTNIRINESVQPWLSEIDITSRFNLVMVKVLSTAYY